MKLLFAAQVATFALTVGGCGFDLSSLEQNNDANSVFRSTFTTSAPADVTNLQGFEEGFSSSDCYLQFNAPFSTVKKLTGNSFTAVQKSLQTQDWLKESVSGIKPDWWQPLVTEQTKLYESPTFHPSYTSGSAILFYNSEKQEAYLYWNGWD